jgi:hypothetical protein
MPLTVEVKYRDGTIAPVSERFATMREAALYAVKLADDLGSTATPYSKGLGAAASVLIRRGGGVEFEVQVFLGGLSPELPREGLVQLPARRSEVPER